jgi:hypothetical protein
VRVVKADKHQQDPSPRDGLCEWDIQYQLLNAHNRQDQPWMYKRLTDQMHDDIIGAIINRLNQGA